MATTLLLSARLLSLPYLAVAFVITPTNARYFLAGYNAMSEEKRRAFDIDCYLRGVCRPCFKKLALFSPLSLLAPTTLLETEDTMVVWSIIQSRPFIWFVWRSYAFQC